jgi:translin
MKNLDSIINKIDKKINNKEKIREQALKSSREIITKCRKSIQLIQRDLLDEAEKFIKEATLKLEELYKITKDFPELIYAGFVENASQECAEAHCLYNIKKGKDLPDPDLIKTTYSSYLMGLCDVVGELRRASLDYILEGETSKASEYLKYMDEIYEAIMIFDYPSGLIPVKRKQDVLRTLIDKTRGELAIASFEQRIDEKTNEICGLIEKNSDKKKNSVKNRESIDIDIDKVW